MNTIGNMTLIRHNQSLGNKPFCEKKIVYDKNSGMQISRQEIINQDVWDEEAIKNRTDWIITFLLEEVIPVPDNMKHGANNYDKK